MSDIYKQAGVDVHAGYRAVDLMKKHIQKTNRPEVIGGVGAFAGLFDLSAFSYEEPVLVSGTDGVGTKLKLAIDLQCHDTVGQDLVAMCVNDIIAQGADPLFFLDYIACGKNVPEQIEQIVKGIADGCAQAGCALIGGETAEMPGMYKVEDYDLAGFVVGIADKKKLITGDSVVTGDVIIGLASGGLHSNGFSLVRKIAEEHQLEWTKTYEPLDCSLGEALLTPTKIYASSVKHVKSHMEIKGISHITGGGFYENIPRALPEHLGVKVKKDSWEIPAIYTVLAERANLSFDEMLGVFNMGIGMVFVVSPEDADQCLELLQQIGEKASVIGEVVDRNGVELTDD
ncbi:phosphoribosylformylglycinamidine cyclo-ligase [Aquibacillus sp. 3ASR75-11]|uniref:Phosphoribosylformylglycinamidine cyclo-ligase n=1 Tax=Terrihalobacillus insolitus TaxID=2950438 RepID=A0A9X3WVM5_9BACI|nr:phosphoribosylformylglycinamidine cyclo-ligase [Terrihalobacillus insolitus]MDC3414197.1 phosphoribosylformylglycinamidine cyclo-ligase [Terrihalobacillus insolitus]MDC3425403.1 phosphoribosylformylglycinamidine cyclo-ligase [Terrihalobacillus insolitus]